LPPFEILIADDDKDDCYLFKQILDELELPIHMTTMSDGEKLMSYLCDATTILPHVLFLDLNMPRKNGFECLSEIKTDEKLKHLPVVVFSTSFEQETVNRLYASGAQYFIRKPADYTQYKTTIQQLVTHISEDNTQQPAIKDFVFTIQDHLTP